MGTMSKQFWMKKAAALSVLSIIALGVGGCSDGEVSDTSAVDPEDVFGDRDKEADGTLDSGPFNEVFDQSFYDEINIYFGEDVTLAADVNQTLTPQAFTLAGSDEVALQPLLVVHAEELPDLEPGTPIVINGQVHEYFEVTSVEEELGVDLDDSLYEEWENEPYLLADVVEAGTSAAP